MKHKRELTMQTDVFPFNQLIDDLVIQVSSYLDVFSLCCLFLTNKWLEKKGIANHFNQLQQFWKKEFEPFNQLEHDLKRLFIVSVTSNKDILVPTQLCFDEIKLNTLDGNNRSLISLLITNNNPRLKALVFNQLASNKQQDPISLLGRAISLDQDNEWLASMLKKIYHSALVDGKTLLQKAVHSRAINATKMLLHFGFDPNEPRFYDEPVLCIAATKGDLEMVRLLLDCAASLEVVNKDDYTPLHIAAQKGFLEIVKILCQFRASLDVQNAKGVTPLYLAMHEGQTEVVSFLLEQGANSQLRHCDNFTPLYTGAYNGHSDALKVLLSYYNKQQLLPNDRASQGDTPLYVAAQNGHVECCRLLLQYGASIDEPFLNGATPLYVAAQNGNVECCQILLQNGALINAPLLNGYTSLYVAVKNGHAECCELLLQYGAKIDAESDGYTPMYAAAQNGDVNVMKELATYEPNYEKIMPNGYTALTAAVQNDHLEVVKFLCLQPVKLNLIDGCGFWPLVIATAKNNLTMLEVLLDAGAEIETQNLDKGYSTALAFAAQRGQLAALEFLISRQANVNSKSANGSTPLHFVCGVSDPSDNHLIIIKRLLKAGANPLLTNNEGKTPLQMATDDKIIRLMKKKSPTTHFFTRHKSSKEEKSKEEEQDKGHCLIC